MRPGEKHAAPMAAESEALWIAFINNEIDLSFTMLRLSEADGPEHSARTMAKAQRGYASAKHFLGQVNNSAVRKSLQQRLDELKAALDKASVALEDQRKSD